MASPQLENGYTRIANSLYEALYKINLTASELRVVSCIIRRTFGYGKKSRKLSASYIAADTGIPVRSVKRALSHLQEMKIVNNINSDKKGSISELTINKDFESWTFWSELSGAKNGTSVTDGTSATDGTGVVSRMAPDQCQSCHPINKHIKKHNKKIYNVEQSPTSDVCREVIEYLNQKTGKRFKPENKATQRHINARIKDGYTLEDLKRVIDLKTGEWLHTEMVKYLRPDTLFAGKFEGYLNACPAAVPKRQEPEQQEEEDGEPIDYSDVERTW
ncbi:MAG: conserved phage C-terminal domain-containing protein [Blautia sp.]